ncbi:MAG TPA: metal-dependent transcriptional regulator [Thermoprotei archaeon]|nr:metal-dependent transcriptional regulator [Thermoprotei archaeon]
MMRSHTIEDYLVAVRICERCMLDPTLSRVSEILRVKPATAYTMIRKLEKMGLVSYNSGKITLTDNGRRIAERTIKKHRITEEFFTSVLGLDYKISHEIAHVIEHFPEKVHNRMLSLIKVKEEKNLNVRPLSSVEGRQSVIVESIEAEDFIYEKYPEIERGKSLKVLEHSFGYITVEVSGKVVKIPRRVANYIFVSRCVEDDDSKP